LVIDESVRLLSAINKPAVVPGFGLRNYSFTKLLNLSNYQIAGEINEQSRALAADLSKLWTKGHMIQLRNVEKTIKSPAGTVWLLRRINVDIKEGEFVTIMGPSGAGKTTLLSIIGMLDDGWAGDYVFTEQLVHKLDRKKRAELNRRFVGFVFQSYHLLDNLTVQENIDVPLSYRDIPRAQRASMVADILDRFQIVGKKDLYPNQLSGGQQQLVGVARAVAGNPKLILADEPTGNLHSGQAKEIMELFRKLNQQGTTIIQVTHSEANAAYGNRIIQLKDGWIVEDSAVVSGSVTA
jgi:putative ABC transport system ATP-binding protein